MKGLEKKRFKVAKAKIKTEDGHYVERWLITDRLVPLYDVNEWVDLKSMRKVSTGKEYAGKLSVYLNYLDMRGKNYREADNKDVMSFILYVIYGDKDNLMIRSLDAQISYSTLSKYITVITEFYKWLDRREPIQIHFDKKDNHKRAKKSFLYGQIYNYEYKYIIDRHILKLTASREYIKWYSDDEIEALSTGFLTLRDQAIFLITLEGFRIDEVLSMRLEDYDKSKNIIRPSRSKGRPDYSNGGVELRTVVLPGRTCGILDRYIFTERMEAENKSGIISPLIFINMRQGKSMGEPLRYRTYWEVLKKCAVRVGMPVDKVRTHSGRSTKAMRMLEHQALHPEDGITDAMILEQFGWKNIESIDHYRDHNNETVAKAVFDKLNAKKGVD